VVAPAEAAAKRRKKKPKIAENGGKLEERNIVDRKGVPFGAEKNIFFLLNQWFQWGLLQRNLNHII